MVQNTTPKKYKTKRFSFLCHPILNYCIVRYTKGHLQEIVRCSFKLKLDLNVILSLSN
jgi:hypothetical protein